MMWENRPRVADWFTRIKARPSFKAIADYPPLHRLMERTTIMGTASVRESVAYAA